MNDDLETDIAVNKREKGTHGHVMVFLSLLTF